MKHTNYISVKPTMIVQAIDCWLFIEPMNR